MTPRQRNMAAAFGLLVLASLAPPLVGCGTNSDDQGGAQGGSNAQAGTGGAAGSGGGSGTGGDVQTGYECSAGGGASGSATTTVPRTCYPYATGAFYCSARLCGCYYHPVTGCLCADNTVSPCKPLDPACTASTAHGTANIGLATVDPNKNVSCYCDMNGYWWCSQ